MPSLYDEMSARAHPDYAGGPPEPRRLRDLLRAAMAQQGFTVYETEWWHFDHRRWRDYPILNVSHSAIAK
jgi:D-alanyl-D-alanine dipeptidase